MSGRRANGEGSIHPRGDGRWAASLSIGHGRRKHFLGHTRAEVAAKLAEALNDQHKGIRIVSSNQNVALYLDFWLNSVKGSVRPRTYESYDLNIRRLKPLIGKTRLSALTPAQVERAYSDLIQGGLTPRSVVQVHTVLHNALKKALQWGYIGRNPTEAVSVPRPERNEMHTLSENEVRRFFLATQGQRLHALWVLLASTGLRVGEATGLRWDDLDLDNCRLFVRRALQRQKGVGLVFVEPKTAKSRRTVYFPEGTAEALWEHHRRQIEEKLRLGPAWNSEGLVFCREDGRPLEATNLTPVLHRILKRAGLPRVRVHDLRHTAATLYLARGENPKIVQELLGHSTITLTLDTYSHVTPAIHAEAAKKMQVLFAEA
jgi:integrase